MLVCVISDFIRSPLNGQVPCDKETLHACLLRQTFGFDVQKDKVTVLSSTIDYIRHLTSSLENKAASPLVRLSEQQLPADRPSTNITAEELAGGASSSISITGPVIVEIEPALATTGNETRSSTSTTLVIRVEAQNHSRSLVHLLNVLHDGFGLQLSNLDYRCVNDRFHATITIEVCSQL